jgi:hypothetical protein
MPPKTRKRKLSEISEDSKDCKDFSVDTRDVYDILYQHFNNYRTHYEKGDRRLGFNDVYKMHKKKYGDKFINNLMQKFIDNGKEFESKEDFLNTIDRMINHMERNYASLETINEEDDEEDDDDDALTGLERILGKDQPIKNFKHESLDFKTIFDKKDGRRSKKKCRSKKSIKKCRSKRSRRSKKKCRSKRSRRSKKKYRSKRSIRKCESKKSIKRRSHLMRRY